ncbi:MAG: glutamine-synthetase adenylyltransferase, partial [Aquificaceae bacterium]|nr:glutamine-synthetase adenylyltransferase [Aquificaceae bacterium]
EGGIREVEFTMQALVLRRWGECPFLRESNTFRAIWKLHQKGVFSDEEALLLEKAYEFLRRLEHAIQLQNCVATQSFSQSDLKRLARVMNTDEETLFKTYQELTRGVSAIFSSIMPSSEEEELHPLQQVLLKGDSEEGKEVLKNYRFRDPVRAFNLLSSYINGREGIKLSTQEKQTFLRVLPKIVETISQTTDPDETLSNFDKFFSNPTGRKVVLSPAREDLIGSLCKIFSLSSYLSTLVGRYPDLVEDVLTLYQDFPEEEQLREEFERYRETLRLSPETLYRRFKRVWEIRTALVHLVKREERQKKLFEFFQKLSGLADFLLGRLWKDMSMKSSLLVALGKYGSGELTVGSDLDLVFVSKEGGPEQAKKSQEFIAFLSKHTPEGYLYRVDFRLRPMGSAGEIAPALSFYREYFQTQARTWERLAWSRCRCVAGEEELRESFE